MKLSITTNLQDIVDTLTDESLRAGRQYVARMGGKKAYDHKQDKFLAKVMRTQKSYVHDIIMFTLPSGNKWCAFEHTTYDSGYAHTRYKMFCYYSTIPYGGIFLPVTECKSVDGENVDIRGAVIYGSHFFERLHERGIYEWKGVKTMAQFIADNTMATSYCTDKKNNKWDVRIYNEDKGIGAIGRGFRSNKANVVYIKTVLADDHLTIRQRRDTSKGRGIADAYHGFVDSNPELMQGRIMARGITAISEGRFDEFINEQYRRMSRIYGMKTEDVKSAIACSAHVGEMMRRIDASVDLNKNAAYPVPVAMSGFGIYRELQKYGRDCSKDDAVSILTKAIKNIFTQLGNPHSDDEIYAKVNEYMSQYNH